MTRPPIEERPLDELAHELHEMLDRTRRIKGATDDHSYSVVRKYVGKNYARYTSELRRRGEEATATVFDVSWEKL